MTIGSESVVIDQVSHIEPLPGTKARDRHLQVAEAMRALKAEISTGVERIPVLLLAQINREGRAAAQKLGRHEFNHLGLSTEIENIADHLWTAFQTEDNLALQRALWQTLKFRRGRPQDWIMKWRLDVGDIRVLHEAGEDE